MRAMSSMYAVLYATWNFSYCTFDANSVLLSTTCLGSDSTYFAIARGAGIPVAIILARTTRDYSSMEPIDQKGIYASFRIMHDSLSEQVLIP